MSTHMLGRWYVLELRICPAKRIMIAEDPCNLGSSPQRCLGSRARICRGRDGGGRPLACHSRTADGDPGQLDGALLDPRRLGLRRWLVRNVQRYLGVSCCTGSKTMREGKRPALFARERRDFEGITF